MLKAFIIEGFSGDPSTQDIGTDSEGKEMVGYIGPNSCREGSTAIKIVIAVF